MKFEAHPYQLYAINYLLERPAAGLFLEMGLGKTVITLTAVSNLLAACKVRRVLIVAPLRVAQTVWAEEAAKWDHTKHLRCVKVLGDAQQRLEALDEQADIYIINRENVQWLQRLGPWRFDCVILDELSSFKSSRAQRFKALRLARPLISRLYGLTGTPTSNGLLDLWSQIYLLDKGDALGRTLGGYRERYFTPGRRNGAIVYDWRLKPGAEDAIYKRLEGLCMSMRAEDYLTLPARIQNIIPVQLSPLAMRRYREMERTYLLELPAAEVSAANAAVVAAKLLQLANGGVYDREGAWHLIHDAKLDALEELVGDEPILVYYAFKHDLARLQARFPDAVQLRSAQDVNDWNAHKIPMLLAHPDSAGHGLNLQAGGRLVVWFGLTWSLEKDQQANARIYRQGQNLPVIIHRLVAKDTIDEQVLQVLSAKGSTQRALIDAVKARMEVL